MRILFVLALLFQVSIATGSAQADCINPVGEEAVIVYNTNYNTMQFCNGTHWVAMAGGISGATIGSEWEAQDQADTADFDGACEYRFQIGTNWHYAHTVNKDYLLFDESIGDFKFGAVEKATKNQWWHRGDGNIAATSGSPAPVAAMQKKCVKDAEPDAFAFNDLTEVTVNTLTPSNTIAVGGFNTELPITITGDGTPEFSIDGGAWATSGTINVGQTLQVRLTSASTMGVSRQAIVTLGEITSEWNVTTVGADAIPAAFTFTDVTGAALAAVVTSNTIMISGINVDTPVSVSGNGNPEISINGGAWGTSGTITNGQSLRIRLTSSAAYVAANTATVNVGGVVDNWSVTTVGQTLAFNMNFAGACGTGYCIGHNGDSTLNVSQATAICTNVKSCQGYVSATTSTSPSGMRHCGWDGTGCFTNGCTSCANRRFVTVTCSGCP